MLMLRCDLLCYIAMPAALCYNFIYVVLSCVISLSICYVYIYIYIYIYIYGFDKSFHVALL